MFHHFYFYGAFDHPLSIHFFFYFLQTNTEKCLPKANEKTECEDSKMVYHNDSLSDSTNRRCIAVEDKMTVL